uniref:Putative general secretion pathway protein L n=1 Tax=mine drainage metagenome TaxID=410659 RepID=E6PJZ9_9ZZZZ
MSTLIVRLHSGSSAGVGGKSTALDYTLLNAGGQATDNGHAQPALLPRAQRVVAVLPAEQLTLLALNLPAMPPQRLQAALAGALEERLLHDPAGVHLAAGPREAGGSVRLACACERAPLAAALQTLAQAGREPAAVVPEPALLAPAEAWLSAMPGGLRLLWRDADGEAAWLHLPTDATAGATPADSTHEASPAPELLTARPTRVLVDPDLQDLATRWFGTNAEITPITHAALLARATQSGWNLRQFELAPQAAMQRGIAGLAKQFRAPAWRRVAMLVGVLLLVQIVGINLVAMKLRSARNQLQTQVQTVVSEALPGTPAVLDARLQMQRALDNARIRAGKPTSTSVEALMGAAAQVLPEKTTIGKLDYTPSQLQLDLGSAQAAAAQARCGLLQLPCKAEGGKLSVGATGDATNGAPDGAVSGNIGSGVTS